MGATYTINATIRAVDTSVSLNETTQLSKQYTATGNDYGKVTQSIGTSTHVALTIPAAVGTNIGQFHILNTDGTNFVSVGRDSGGTFVPLLRVRAGRFAIGEYEPNTVPYAKADTAAVVVAHSVGEL